MQLRTVILHDNNNFVGYILLGDTNNHRDNSNSVW